MAEKTKINDYGDCIYTVQDALDLLYTNPDFDISKLFFDLPDKYKNFDPWWLRADTATYDRELDKGIYTGHFSWNEKENPVDKSHENHAKIFEFNPKVLDGGKGKNK